MPPKKKTTSSKKKKTAKATTQDEGGEVKNPTTTSTTSSATNIPLFPPPLLQLYNNPKLGWGRELQDAIIESKQDPSSVSKHVRVVKAAVACRQWVTSQKAAETGLALLGDLIKDGTVSSSASSSAVSSSSDSAAKKNKKKQKQWNFLSSCHKAASTEISQNKRIGGSYDLTKLALKGMDLDGSPQPSNLANGNNLHSLAFSGDIRGLELIVALGAALDYPVGDDFAHRANCDTSNKMWAPPGSTALMLSLVTAGLTKLSLNKLGGKAHESNREQYQGSLQCACALVMLGANVHKRLEIPAVFKAKSRGVHVKTSEKLFVTIEQLGWNGKTVEEMIVDLNNQELLDAVHLMNEARVEHAWCRCGSRLPWQECHASPAVAGQRPYYREEDGTLVFAASPLGKCPCGGSRKRHFDCCWETSFRPIFKNDETGKLSGHNTISYDPDATEIKFDVDPEKVFFDWINTGKRPPVNMIFPGKPEEICHQKADEIRSSPPFMWQMMMNHPCPEKIKAQEWDQQVYAGIVERLDDFFIWLPVHWRLSKPELLHRVKLWNRALEKYCDDMGLTGAKRDDIVKKHAASPFGPCANPSCGKMEKKVKEFQKCARCKTVAYCSRECQVKHYKQHKARGCSAGM